MDQVSFERADDTLDKTLRELLTEMVESGSTSSQVAIGPVRCFLTLDPTLAEILDFGFEKYRDLPVGPAFEMRCDDPNCRFCNPPEEDDS